jgi:hypothetical protein
VQVVDQNGKPIAGMLVRLDYQNYSVEQEGHEEDRITDGSGHAKFPRHTSSASLLRRCYYTAQSGAAFAHASFGPHDSVFALGNHLEGSATSGEFVTDWTGHPAQMESRIVAHPAKY